jgi:hypothetical protein
VIPAFVDRLRLELRHVRRKPHPPRLARFFVAHPGLAAAITVALLAGGVALYGVIGSDFLPAMDEGSIILDYWTPPGTSLTDTDAMLQEVERIIAATPDVQAYSRRTGEQLGFFVTEPNTGDYVIRLKPRGSRRGVEAVIDDLRERIARTEPAIRADFGQILEDNIYDLSGGVPQPVDVRIYGEDQPLLQQKAREAAAILRGIPRVVDVFDGITISGPKLYVEPKLDALARFGLSAEALHSEVEPALGGTVAGRLRVGRRLYDIRVYSRGALDLAALPHLRISTPAGAAVPLSDLATVKTGPPDVEIQRENLRTYLGVTARLDDVSLGAAAAEIRRRLSAGLALPPGISLRYAGLIEQQESSFKGLLGVPVRRPAARLRHRPLPVRGLACRGADRAHGGRRADERARLSDRDRNDAQRLELRRRDHDGRDRRREGRLPHPRRAGRSASRRPGRRRLGRSGAPEAARGHDDDLRHRLRPGAARVRARRGLAAPAAARDRRHRRIHPLEPARPPHPAVAVPVARSEGAARRAAQRAPLAADPRVRRRGPAPRRAGRRRRSARRTPRPFRRARAPGG